ncbi:MAG: FAD-binding oxidoreductase, partial [Deltaproteobacteria bacterium]|nr:FAD-binding oxidoreductase [Deltaproteobacteria bacterium]
MKAIAGPSGVLTAPTDVEGHTVDWRKRYSGPTDAVLLPRTTSEVSALVKLCVAERISIIPQGGNTGQSGGSVPLANQSLNAILCLGRLNKVREISRDNNTITVEAGVVLQTVQEAAETIDRYFPLSLGAEGSCQIGGNLATNAGGTAVLRYGNARDMVLGLEVVLPSGEIWNGLRTLRKDNTGYDIKSLFLGSEGTLGIITAAALKLYSRPVESALAWVAVDGMAPAVNLLSQLRDTLDSRLSAFEYLSCAQLELVLKHVAGHSRPLANISPGYVLIELSDSLRTDTLNALLEMSLESALDNGLITDAIVATSGAQAAALWKIRHSVSEANRAHGVSLNHDVAVPTAALPDFTAEATAHINAHFPQAEVITVAHMGDGNVHFLTIFPREFWATHPDANAYTAEVRRSVYTLANQYQGT